MQLALEKRLSSFDIGQLTVGRHQSVQSPHDHIERYSQGIQTDLIMIHDVATETRKITLDSSVQCSNESLNMYTQTEVAFTKNKVVQTGDLRNNGTTQTDKPKLRNTVVQTAAKMYNDKCQQVSKNEAERVDASTETEVTISFNEGTMTDHMEVYITSPATATENGLEETISERSESPPLTPDKECPGPSFSLPFVSIFNPMAVRLPNIGTYRIF